MDPLSSQSVPYNIKAVESRWTYDSTTTIGDSELVTRHNPFHIIKPEETTVRKLSAWKSSCGSGSVMPARMRTYALEAQFA
jgi:hypothetical protein